MAGRIKAFTLQEILIALVIAAIVISAAFYSYGVIQTAYLAYQKTTEQSLEIKTLDVLLKEDFAKADYVIKSSDGIICMINENEVNYLFKQDYVTRTVSILTEYFKVKPEAVHLFFDKLAVENNNELIDELSYNAIDNDKLFYFHYNKIYGADKLIQKTTLNY